MFTLLYLSIEITSDSFHFKEKVDVKIKQMSMYKTYGNKNGKQNPNVYLFISSQLVILLFISRSLSSLKQKESLTNEYNKSTSIVFEEMEIKIKYFFINIFEMKRNFIRTFPKTHLKILFISKITYSLLSNAQKY